MCQGCFWAPYVPGPVPNFRELPLEEADTPGQLKDIVSPRAGAQVTKGTVGEQRKALAQDTRLEQSPVFFLEAVKFLARGRRGQGEPAGRALAFRGASGQEGE